MPNNNETFEKVRDTLVDALGVDDDEVTPEATLIGDLQAESIDFLDIVFRLEKNFSIRIPRGELFPDFTSIEEENDGIVTGEGVVKEEVIDALRQRMPHTNIDEFAQDPKVENIQDLFTVQMILNFVEAKLAAGE